ncbi:MAG: hypothetical protein J2P27_17170, partial [Actinobacteria bacterium]|nr:hypothetical protein [Actinomycetota bacterium]
MSIQDERELRTQLAGLLDGTEPRSAPVSATVRLGRTIRVRRRVAAAAVVAAAVAVAVVLPSVVSAPPRSAVPLGPAHYKVTVDRLDPVAHGGVIARGVTDGKSWKVVASGQSKEISVHIAGLSGVADMGGGPTATAAPVEIGSSIGDYRFTASWGTVSSAVTRVVVLLPDGEYLTLTPVLFDGYRWVGLVVPAHVPFVRAVAYSAAGELAYSVPFQGTSFEIWWLPGRTGPPRLTRQIGSGVIDGKSWNVTAHIGPWGWCYTLGTFANRCERVGPDATLNGELVSNRPVGCAFYSAGPTYGVAAVASGVRRVSVSYSNGTIASSQTVPVTGGRVVAYTVPAHVQVTAVHLYGPG